MKLFISVNLPKEVKDYLWELKEEFRGLGNFRFEPKRNYHITLKFLGEIEEGRLDYIRQRLSGVNFYSFRTSLRGLGNFNYRVLWADSEPKDNILQLARKVDEHLIEYPNDFAFSDHITLARIKSLKNKKELEKRLKIHVEHIEFKISSFELMKSESSKDGSRYTVLETYSLEQ